MLGLSGCGATIGPASTAATLVLLADRVAEVPPVLAALLDPTEPWVPDDVAWPPAVLVAPVTPWVVPQATAMSAGTPASTPTRSRRIKTVPRIQGPHRLPRVRRRST